jgi:hypothetical protein
VKNVKNERAKRAFSLQNERNEKNGKITVKLSIIKAFCARVFYLQSKKTEILLLRKKLRGMRNSHNHMRFQLNEKETKKR